MNFKLPLFLSLIIALSCRQKSNEQKELVVVDTEIASIRQDHIILWSDSGTVQFKPNIISYTYPNIDYDSVRLVYYWGYNLDQGLDTTSFFPVNKNGEWISTIMNSVIIGKEDLTKVDSLLGNRMSFDNSASAERQCPKYGLVYFKKGEVIGQTTLGPGSQTVRTTFKLPQPCYFQRLNNSECRKIEVVFWKKLHLHSF